jgi:2-polyprenyl-3-methyl-5-hydroxy-6-metoxy-1,4-benzoquinol methylase
MNTNWIDLWNKVAAVTPHTPERQKRNSGKKHFRRDSPLRPDPLLDFVLKELTGVQSFLDIGAGNGRWAIPAAKIARKVTALEPSDSMLEMLHENVSKTELDNIQIIQGRWEDTNVESHDIVSCTHAIYETMDFTSFIRKMEEKARERCYLVLRIPPHDGITGELSRIIHGHPYDSPNAHLAYNALYSMGIYPNIMVEEDMHNWKDATFEEAFSRVKRHLNVETTGDYDDLIRKTLTKRLTLQDGVYIWPDGMRAVLFWWHPRKLGINI